MLLLLKNFIKSERSGRWKKIALRSGKDGIMERKYYQCQKCGKFITEEEGVTCIDGSWVCDNDNCRTLDEDNEAHINN